MFSKVRLGFICIYKQNETSTATTQRGRLQGPLYNTVRTPTAEDCLGNDFAIPDTGNIYDPPNFLSRSRKPRPTTLGHNITWRLRHRRNTFSKYKYLGNKSKTATPCVKIRVQLNESKSNQAFAVPECSLVYMSISTHVSCWPFVLWHHAHGDLALHLSDLVHVFNLVLWALTKGKHM